MTLLEFQTATERLQSNEEIVKVYSGKRRGCMCGCLGDYRYTAKHGAIESARRGYDFDVNEVQVTRVRKIMLEHLDAAEAGAGLGDETYLYLDHPNGRVYAIYLQ